MSRLTLLLLAICLSCCGAPPTPKAADAARPMRIVSLDYCADQYVLKFVDKDRILAVSPDAARDFSYMQDVAGGVPTVRPVAEDVLLLKPDLVVRSYGGGPDAAKFFAEVGIPVLDIGWAPDLKTVMSNIQRVADGLDEHERGAEVVTQMETRLQEIAQQAEGKSVLYMTPAGVTTGPGTLVHEIITAAGLENFQTQSGWRSIPLEELAYRQPDIIGAAFFETLTNHPDAWSPMKHPVALKQLSDETVVPLKGAWTSCNGWFLMDAVEALAEGAKE